MREELPPLLWVGSQRQFDDPSKGFWVAVPVILRRLIVESPPEIQDSDPFARAVVNLATAGVQRIPDIATLIGIEDLDFVQEVIRRLSELKIVRVKSGLVNIVGNWDERDNGGGEKHVWYVLQDSYSGTLWPRVASSVIKPPFDEQHRIVEMGNPGKPVKRRYWSTSSGEEVEDPTLTVVKQAVNRHLADVRTVGIKHNSRGFEHIARLGRPERKPVFSARLAPGREKVRLLLKVDVTATEVSISDPFGVGAWFELAAWTERLLVRSPDLCEQLADRASRADQIIGKGSDAELDKESAVALGRPSSLDVTLSRPVSPRMATDRNSLLLTLADRLREELGSSPQGHLALSYDDDRNVTTICQRWSLLGFRGPFQLVRPVSVLIERAAKGDPAELHVLFYAWTLLVEDSKGMELARLAPDLPLLLYENVNGRTNREIPQLRMTSVPQCTPLSESRN